MSLRQSRGGSRCLLADLRSIDAGTISALVATFAAGPETLEAATADVDPITDAHPFMEHDARSTIVETQLPAALLDPSGMDRWCGGCVSRSASRDSWELPYLEKALQAFYGSERFLHYAQPSRGNESWGEVEDLLWREPCVTQALRDSPHFAAVFHEALRGVPQAACRRPPEELR